MNRAVEVPTVRLLGPIDVETPRGVVTVGGHGPRALIGALAMSPCRAVPIDYLIDVLWGDAPPGSAGNVLQSYVSRLRHQFGHGFIVLTDHSYSLDCHLADVDALHFERLLREAEAADDPAERLRHCQQALRLWRGRPFGELADEAPFELEAYRLDELRLLAMELSLEAELRLGRYEMIVSELESSVREHPYRERLWFLLIEALALSDRRTEALRACADLRRTLGDVGIEIDHKVAALERQILDGEPIAPV